MHTEQRGDTVKNSSKTLSFLKQPTRSAVPGTLADRAHAVYYIVFLLIKYDRIRLAFAHF